MTSYSRIFYEVYDPLTGRALAPPTDYETASAYAQESGGEIRFVAAHRLTKNCPPEGPVPARHDGEGEARISGGLAPKKRDWVPCPECGEPDMRRENGVIYCANLSCPAHRDFFDDEIVPAVNADRLGNQIAHEGADRCFCGCKYWEHDRCIDCGTHVTTVREFPA